MRQRVRTGRLGALGSPVLPVVTAVVGPGVASDLSSQEKLETQTFFFPLWYVFEM